VVAAIVEVDGKLLLARDRAWPEKMFALVTGFLERDEHPATAVLREVKQETDLDADAATLVGACDFARMSQVILGYHVQTRGTVRLSEELAEVRD
jgi:ADP-ribose pyrophosphatase YjhB (NUDIX family)